MSFPKRFACCVAASTLGFLLVAHAQDSGPSDLLKEFVWRPIGPTTMGGRVDDVEAVESDPSIIYVGAATSGVWKTDNNGTTWKPIRQLRDQVAGERKNEHVSARRLERPESRTQVMKL